MSDKASIILRDLLLEALETYREDDNDTEAEYFRLLGNLMKKAKEGFLDLKSGDHMKDGTSILLRNMILDSLESARGYDPNSDAYYHLSEIMENIKKGYLDVKTMGLIDTLISNVIYNDPDTYEHFLAESYAKELCSLIPDVTERASKLLTKAMYKDMDSTVERYMEEANRCYIYGFFLAAGIMCRGAIEYSLKKYLGKTESKGDNIKYSIKELIDEAINKPGRFKKSDGLIALGIYNGASDCVHGRRQIDSVKCLEYVNNTKLVIKKLLR